jgi:hypothetical protein
VSGSETGRIVLSDTEALAHPLVQAELERQARDLRELLRVPDADLREAVSRFCERAVHEALVFWTLPLDGRG